MLVFFIVFLATCFGHTIWPSSGYLRGYALLYYITLHTYYIYIYTTTRPASPTHTQEEINITKHTKMSLTTQVPTHNKNGEISTRPQEMTP
jgi:hypothetical protein